MFALRKLLTSGYNSLPENFKVTPPEYSFQVSNFKLLLNLSSFSETMKCFFKTTATT